MAEPFVFHFSPGLDGAPLLMVIADLDMACGLCKHPQIQRFYHATPFEDLTVSTYKELVACAYLKGGYECENCGEQCGPEHVERSTLTLGFPDDSGLIRGFWARNAGVRYVLIPERRLDPQALPGFSPPPEAEELLTEAQILGRLGRPLSLRMCWRGLADQALSEDDELWIEMKSGTLGLRPSESSDEEPETDADEFETDELEIGLPPNAAAWLGKSRSQKLTDADFELFATIDLEILKAIIERTFGVAQITYDLDSETLEISNIKTPQGIEFSGKLNLEALAEESVVRGLMAGDLARLKAEEVVGQLLRVWKPTLFEHGGVLE